MIYDVEMKTYFVFDEDDQKNEIETYDEEDNVATYNEEEVAYDNDYVEEQIEEIVEKYGVSYEKDIDDDGNIRVIIFKNIDISDTDLSEMINRNHFHVVIVLPDQFPNLGPEGYYYPAYESLKSEDGDIVYSDFKKSDKFDINYVSFDNCGPLVYFWDDWGKEEDIDFFWHKVTPKAGDSLVKFFARIMRSLKARIN